VENAETLSSESMTGFSIKQPLRIVYFGSWVPSARRKKTIRSERPVSRTLFVRTWEGPTGWWGFAARVEGSEFPVPGI